MKITRSKLKEIIKEIDLSRLAGKAHDDYHLLLLETAELYKELATMRPDENFLHGRIKRLHASFSRMYKRAKKWKSQDHN